MSESRPGNVNIDRDIFFDIHMHAFNLSHPYFMAFLKRYRLLPESLLEAGFKWVTLVAVGLGVVFGIVFGLVFWLSGWSLIISLLVSFAIFVVLFVLGVRILPWLRTWLVKLINKGRDTVFNMLPVLENDIGSYFLIVEDCLREVKDRGYDQRPLFNGDDLEIGGRKYRKIVLTPLMMDFGYKGKSKESSIHYNKPAEKPIADQVIDVFNGVKKYMQSPAKPLTKEEADRFIWKYPNLGTESRRIMEIYPFLGLNTSIYDLDYVKKLLDKYFEKPDASSHKYRGLRDDLKLNLGQFTGKIDDLPSNYFAGVKVYPPLGFDPWPADKKQWDKVDYLYKFCASHKIPITCHGGSSGFVTVVNKRELASFTSISKWQDALKHAEYKGLKLNIAHFPTESVSERKIPGRNFSTERQRLDGIIGLILDRDLNVYTDFSCRGTGDKYYATLRKVLDSQKSADDKTRLTEHILFGSDFPVNLGAANITSYNKYVQLFRDTPYLEPPEKEAFCCVNPQYFLFG